MRDLEDKTFLLLLVAISLAFLLILWPFSGAIIWGTVFAIVFAPLYRALLRLMGERESLAAIITLTLILLIVILPLILILTLIFREAAGSTPGSKPTNSILRISFAPPSRRCRHGQGTDLSISDWTISG